MRKFLRIEDPEYKTSSRYELSSLSYDEFMALDLWFGGSDIAFSSWLQHNGYSEASDFNQESIDHSFLDIEQGDGLFEFQLEDDGPWMSYADASAIAEKRHYPQWSPASYMMRSHVAGSGG